MKSINKLILSLVLIIAALFAVKGEVFADSEMDCESTYGGGETCLVNKRFRIEKDVRLEDDDSWEDKVNIDLTDKDEKGKFIEFRIRVKNLSDEDANLDFDNMEMKDKLPDVFDRIGGSGLTEGWDNFEPGETKEFKIKVELDDEELDKEGEFEKCAVNKASVYWDDEFEGSDTATVCWSNEEVKELPKTGSLSEMSIAGLVLVSAGVALKKSKKVTA